MRFSLNLPEADFRYRPRPDVARQAVASGRSGPRRHDRSTHRQTARHCRVILRYERGVKPSLAEVCSEALPGLPVEVTTHPDPVHIACGRGRDIP